MQSKFFRYHFGIEWEKRKIVRKVLAKSILQTAPHNSDSVLYCFVFQFCTALHALLMMTAQSMLSIRPV